MYSKCFSCRLYDSLLCGRSCEDYSHFDPICKRLYYYVDSSNTVKGPVEAYMLLYYGVTSMSYVWTKGMKDWMQAYHISELHFIPAPIVSKDIDENGKCIRKENFLSAWNSIPLVTRIVYALYLLAILFFVFCHLLGIMLISLEGVSRMIAFLIFVGLPFVFNAVSIWGLWQLLRHKRKAGFWYAILSFCFNFIVYCAMIGWTGFDYQGTLAHPTSYDAFREYSYPILGGFVGFAISYIFIGILWSSLYFKRNGLVFMSCLNNEKLIFPLNLLRLFPIILLLLFIVFWTVMSIFFY